MTRTLYPILPLNPLSTITNVYEIKYKNIFCVRSLAPEDTIDIGQGKNICQHLGTTVINSNYRSAFLAYLMLGVVKIISLCFAGVSGFEFLCVVYRHHRVLLQWKKKHFPAGFVVDGRRIAESIIESFRVHESFVYQPIDWIFGSLQVLLFIAS